MAEFSSGHERVGDTLYFYCRDGQGLMRKLVELDLHNYLTRPATLEDVFLKLTGRTIRDDVLADDKETTREFVRSHRRAQR